MTTTQPLFLPSIPTPTLESSQAVDLYHAPPAPSSLFFFFFFRSPLQLLVLLPLAGEVREVACLVGVRFAD